MNDASRFCKDCRYMRPDERLPADESYFWWCDHPSLAVPAKIDPLTGAQSKPSAEYCQHARNYDHLCGPEGRYWEPRGFG